MTAPRSALLLGATGLVGGRCLARLLTAPEITRVIIPGRRPPKLAPWPDKAHFVPLDFDSPETAQDVLRADVLLIAFGTTRHQAGSREAFEKVDYQYPRRIAAIAQKNGCPRAVLVSAMGAGHRAPFQYSRLKARLEQAIIDVGFESVTILRPATLKGPRQSPRPAEKLALWADRLLAPLIAPCYRAVDADTVAAAMIRAATAGRPGVRIVASHHLESLHAAP